MKGESDDGDRGITCTAARTVPRDRESLKGTGADPSGISISVPESESLGSHRRIKSLERLRARVRLRIRQGDMALLYV